MPGLAVDPHVTNRADELVGDDAVPSLVQWANLLLVQVKAFELPDD